MRALTSILVIPVFLFGLSNFRGFKFLNLIHMNKIAGIRIFFASFSEVDLNSGSEK